jgi:hypothetical protein
MKRLFIGIWILISAVPLWAQGMNAGIDNSTVDSPADGITLTFETSGQSVFFVPIARLSLAPAIEASSMVQPVPEPSTSALVSLACVCFLVKSRSLICARRKRV